MSKSLKENEVRRNRLETALYKWLESTEIIENDVINLIDKNNVSRSKISRDMDNMENKLMVLKNNLKNY